MIIRLGFDTLQRRREKVYKGALGYTAARVTVQSHSHTTMYDENQSTTTPDPGGRAPTVTGHETVTADESVSGVAEASVAVDEPVQTHAVDPPTVDSDSETVAHDAADNHAESEAAAAVVLTAYIDIIRAVAMGTLLGSVPGSIPDRAADCLCGGCPSDRNDRSSRFATTSGPDFYIVSINVPMSGPSSMAAHTEDPESEPTQAAPPNDTSKED